MDETLLFIGAIEKVKESYVSCLTFIRVIA